MTADPCATWLALHLPQLEHYAVPHHLHEQVYQCVHQADASALALDELVTVDPLRHGRRKQRVLAKRAIPAEAQARRVDHIWTFASVVEAQTQLRQDAALRSTMTALVRQVVAAEGDDGVGEVVDSANADEKEEEVESVVKQLHLLAFSIRFDVNADDLYSYYVLNATGSSAQSNLQVVPIFCLQQQKLFSVAWPTKDIAAGDELVRPYASKISLMALCKKSYWEARFEGEDEFDWYCKYTHIRDLLASYLAKTDRVLVAGTGTSLLPADMALDGYSDVVAMDYAANVIEKMQARSAANAWGVSFVEADLTRMLGWESNSVDCVVDKGCLDAMLLKPETDAVETDWKLVAPDSPDDLQDAKSSMRQLERILKPDGLLFFLTFGSPSNRVHMFDWVESSEDACMEWEILQCLEMSPTSGLQSFSTRFYLFVARKKLK
ncbi:hypothetical protein BBJ28_00008509 [Nothophytophthora sp. Chile5]|nr:hypothetical protein BBJ28_00008509 [Nothophytophthora sp. Chile5]